MKKRLLAGLMALFLTAAALAGCGKEGTGDRESDPQIEADNTGESDGLGESEGTEQSDGSGTKDPGNEQGDAQQEGDQNPEELPVLKDAVMENLGCRVGAAVTQGDIRDEQVWNLVTTYFNALTIGNELKPDAMFGYSLERCPGTEEAELNGETIIVPKMDYSRAEAILDKVLEWNQAHPDDQIKMRGHVLVWHAQTQEWFFHVDYDKNKDYVDKETMDKRLEWYIRTMLTHFTGEDSKYKGMFYGWDVVNEAVSDATGTYRTDQENPNEPLSQDRHNNNSSWWHVYQSNEYIINAFKYANKYAPADLELYYNDYNECSFTKRKGILELLTAVKEQEGPPGEGTRIDAMGMQGHYSMASPQWHEIEDSARRYCAVVGNVQLTELDMKSSDGYDGSEEAKAEEYEKQAARYGVIYWTLKNANKDDDFNITGITFWGTADHLSWLQTRSDVGGGNAEGLPECPLLFDENFEPKPAYYRFLN